MAIKLRPRWVSRSKSKLRNGDGGGSDNNNNDNNRSCEIKWEVRPGGMLVQKRDFCSEAKEEMVNVRISTGSCNWHAISIEATSTFGELKVMVSMVSGLEPWEQRLLFRGKERDDSDHLHMVGVKNMDKVLLLEDPAIKEKKQLHAMGSIPFYTSTIEV